MSISQIIGHHNIRQRLNTLLEAGKLPSSLCFCGASGIGKLLCAKELGSALLCDRSILIKNHSDRENFYGCGDCNSCRLFSKDNHPDYFQINCAIKEECSVASIRELLQNLAMRPFNSSVRVAILNDAELLSIQAANILLKSLEEPRPGTYFILVSANQARLPVTLLSRCQVWNFNPLNQAEIKSIIRQKFSQDLDASALSNLDEIAFLSDGSLDSFEQIVSNLDVWREIKECLNLLDKGFSSNAFNFMRDIARDKEGLPNKLNQIRIFARHKMLNSTENEAKLRWSIFLSDLIASERLIFDRNISASYLLGASICSFLAPSHRLFFTPNSLNATLLENVAL